MADFSDHVCGIYSTLDDRRVYLPQVKLESHTTINPDSFTTQLQQTFQTTDTAQNLRYTFPLYDGIAVSGYTITYGDKTLTGIVKQKDDAKKTYRAAVDRGETAALLESLPAGVFGVTLGNVPAHAELLVDITYCGELKHDAAVDGLRYTLPTSIAPRYGSYPGTVVSNNSSATSMRLTVDVNMGDKSVIRRIQSPSHPIAVTMGELSAASPDGRGPTPYSPAKASATLSRGSAELGHDFVLHIVIDDLSRPQAIVEVHPTIANQRAIMATVVPKFVLESANPEVIFIADQSGSMSGSKNAALVAALKVFLKSLPWGVRFNICAFGNAFQFLWNTSQAYSEENVDRAIEFVSGFSANFGGTELLNPIKAAFERHLQDMPLEVLVLTDGQIWQEHKVFQYIDTEIQSGVDARVFTLGIGQDVSHTLVEGLARAGNGFAQFVTQNEDTDQKVIRMLKGALYAHTKEYSLEVHYADDTTEKHAAKDDEDFELVEKVQDCLTITTAEENPTKPVKPQSFFDTSADLDKTTISEDRYSHLPLVDVPKLLQAPSRIPPLFPFNRTTLYILLDENSARKDVKSVTLRATSASGPLELEIPVSDTTHGTSIHQLAARKAIQDLEEGRGWLHSARLGNADQLTIKKKYESRFDELVEREAARLGEKFQVASKWTSFVAVERGEADSEDNVMVQQLHLESVSPAHALFGMNRTTMASAQFSGPAPAPVPVWNFRAPQAPTHRPVGHAARSSAPRSAWGQGIASFHDMQRGKRTASARSRGQAMFVAQAPRATALHSIGTYGAAELMEEAEASDENMDFELCGTGDQASSSDADMALQTIDTPPPPKKNLSSLSSTSSSRRKEPAGDNFHELINLQTFSGAWTYSAALMNLLQLDEQVLHSFKYDRDSLATALVIAYLEHVLTAKKDVWEMVVHKAWTWLVANLGGIEKADELVRQAKRCMGVIEHNKSDSN